MHQLLKDFPVSVNKQSFLQHQKGSGERFEFPSRYFVSFYSI
jgi:hypothetical protein